MRRTGWVTELKQRERKSSVPGNKKVTPESDCPMWRVRGHIYPGWGLEEGGDTNVSMEPARLLRFLPCHPRVPEGVKHWFGDGLTEGCNTHTGFLFYTVTESIWNQEFFTFVSGVNKYLNAFKKLWDFEMEWNRCLFPCEGKAIYPNIHKVGRQGWHLRKTEMPNQGVLRCSSLLDSISKLNKHTCNSIF